MIKPAPIYKCSLTMVTPPNITVNTEIQTIACATFDTFINSSPTPCRAQPQLFCICRFDFNQEVWLFVSGTLHPLKCHRLSILQVLQVRQPRKTFLMMVLVMSGFAFLAYQRHL